jgi:uncharacterized protein (TIGR00369 family)
MSRSGSFASSRALDRELAALTSGEYPSRLGLRAARVDGADASVELPFDPSITNRGGRVHGGALASLLLAAARIAAAASERADSERRVRLLAVNVAFLSVPRHGRLIADARVVRRGRDIAHAAVSAVDEDGASIASAAIALGLIPASVGADGVPVQGADTPSLELAAGSRVPGSPYLSAAGVLVLPPDGGSARALLPRQSNRASDPSRIDEGAIAGLADSCAAYAAHMRAPRASARGGVTVSMALVFHASRDEDLIGVGVVNGNAAGCHTAAVDIVGACSGTSVASGFTVYRLPG